MNKLLKNKSGFTLIELLIVIAILAILVSLGMPRLMGYTQRAELTRIQHDVKVMENYVGDLFSEIKDYNTWETNHKDLGSLILKEVLFEREGVAKRLDMSHLNNENKNVAIGRGPSVTLKVDSDNEENTIQISNANSTRNSSSTNDEMQLNTGYKIVPEEYKSKIKTKLKGTFYINENGKVYYEHDKPLKGGESSETPNCPFPIDYEFDHLTGTIIKYTGKELHLNIPSAFQVDGECWLVKRIGKGAFSNGNLDTVTLPPTIERIDDEAFKDNNLKELEIPNGSIDIGDDAFRNNQIEEIVVKGKPGDITTGNGTFDNNGLNRDKTIIPKYEIPTDKDLGINFDRESGKILSKKGNSQVNNGNKGGNANNGNANNGNNVIIIPPTIIVDGKEYPVKEVDKGAFQGDGLISVNLPEGLEEIGDYAFAGNQLIGINMPDSVKKIGNYAFAYNEINDLPTMKTIEIQSEEQLNKLGNVGDIEENGSKVDILKGLVNLLDHIFVNSTMNYKIPSDYNPIEELTLRIIMGNHINDQMDLWAEYEYDGVSTKAEWELNGVSVDKISGKLPEGNHVVRLRVLDEFDKWTKWVRKEFQVHKYSEKLIIPEGTKTIPKNAYKGAGITELELPDSLEKIEDYAFANNQIKVINLPANLKYLGDYAFAYNRTGTGNANYKGTITSITHKGVEYLEDLGKHGDISKDGEKLNTIGNMVLKDRIFKIKDGDASDIFESQSFNLGTFTFTVPETGKYQLEVWGAQGGRSKVSAGRTGTGGRGGYTKGYLDLIKGQKITISVGKRGANNSTENAGQGGGVTNIQIDNKVVIAGGGGGGGGYYVSGGNPPYGQGSTSGGRSLSTNGSSGGRGSRSSYGIGGASSITGVTGGSYSSGRKSEDGLARITLQ